MILVDTSVWVQHLRAPDARLAAILNRGEVLTHPFVIGELAMGGLVDRAELLADLQRLPRANTADDAEVLDFVERAELHGRGIGYIDAHLLASVRLTPGSVLWTRDRRLSVAAAGLSLSARLD